MKTKIAPGTPRAFTLIELLFVITIIGMLAGLVAAAANRVLDNAKRTKTHATRLGIVQALANYRTEYNRYPIPAGRSGEEPVSLSAGNPILEALLGENDNKLNPTATAFLAPPPANNGIGGLSGTKGSYALTDLWGTPFEVVVDSNFDNKIANPDAHNQDPSIAKNAAPLLFTGAIAMSHGPDKKKDTKDDVVSWRN